MFHCSFEKRVMIEAILEFVLEWKELLLWKKPESIYFEKKKNLKQIEIHYLLQKLEDI